MPRVQKGAARRRKHNRVLKDVKGFYGVTSRRYRLAITASIRAGVNATKGRKLRKRDFRSLWITRIAAACQQRGLRYSQFIHAMSLKDIRLNRKVLADIAVADPAAFDAIVQAATA